ncbi:MAG: HEAT repeat domain-containing protein [Planctomycetes bacterium]|nr:HEAT repeat domain-containing protein [Planctomycetota bacterium]
MRAGAVRLPAAAAAAALLLLPAAALPHGGQYQPRNPVGIPPDSEILDPRVPVPTPPERREMTAWERWWDVNGEKYVDLRRRVRERDGPRGRVSDGPEGGAGADAPAPGDGGPTAREFLEAEVLPVLTASLRDEDPEVRSAALLALGKIGFPRTLMDLQPLLSDRDRDVREAAVLALGMVGDGLAVLHLQAFLLDPREDERTRGFAALGLGIIGGEEAGKALLSYLDPASDARRVGGVRRRTETECCVVAALGILRHASAVGPLEGVIRGRMPDGSKAEASVRSFALVSLARLGAPGTLGRQEIAMMLHEEGREVVRQGAAIALGILGRSGQAPLDAFLHSSLVKASRGDGDFGVRVHADMALARIGGPEAVLALRGTLEEAARVDAPFLALALGIAGDAPSAPELLRMFRTGNDPNLRGALALSLGLLRHAPAAPDLRAVAFGKGPREVRRWCMLALGLLGDGASAEPLLEVVTTDWDPFLKNGAGTALGLLGDREAPGRVAACAKGATSILARGHACRILGMIGNRDSARLLLRFAADRKETGYLRMFAVTGLGILGERKDVPLLRGIAFDLDAEIRNDPLDTLAGFM